MPRSPMDKIPQRVLVHDLKRAIDQRATQGDTRVRHLVSENPRSARSTHVLKNLGRERVAILASILGEPLRVRAGARQANTTHDSYSSEAPDGAREP